MDNKFVFANKNINLKGKIVVEKNDVGIVEYESENGAVVFFVRAGEKIETNKEDIGFFNVKKAGDAFPKKICNVCHKLLSTKEFQKNQNGINNRTVRRPSCGKCRIQLEGKSMSVETRREWMKKKPVNIPFECPICSKRTIAGITSKVVLDHDHVTGKARGWICDSCNTGIGRFKDDVELMKKAIKFLE